MNKKKLVPLVDENSPQMQQLKKAIKDNNSKRMHIRYMVIFNHLEGYTNQAIAKTQNLVGHTVGTYVNAYKQHGLEGLVMGKSTGKPKFLSDEQEKKLLEVVTTKTPDEVGFENRKNWDCNLIVHWIFNTYGIEYKQRSILDVLHRLNLSYTRPTYTLEKADPELQEQFKQDFEVLKKS